MAATQLLMRMAEIGKRMVEAINAGAAEETNSLAALFLEMYARISDGEKRRFALPLATDSFLSVREAQVIAMTALGNDADNVAALLQIAPATVRTHLRNARGKGKIQNL